jgi:hypothetical protein
VNTKLWLNQQKDVLIHALENWMKKITQTIKQKIDNHLALVEDGKRKSISMILLKNSYIKIL